MKSDAVAAFPDSSDPTLLNESDRLWMTLELSKTFDLLIHREAKIQADLNRTRERMTAIEGLLALSQRDESAFLSLAPVVRFVLFR